MSILSKMYGNNKSIPKVEKVEPQEQSKGFRVLGGMKITGSHIKTLELGEGKTAQFPSVEYVRLLEVQISEIRKVNSSMKEEISSLKRKLENHTSMIRAIQEKVNSIFKSVY